MTPELPELSRFELQCLRRLWTRGEASVRDVQADFPAGPSYSTFRKIFERLEAKGAVERTRRDGRAWVYRSKVSSSRIIRKEIRRLIDGLFDGRSRPLLAHLADMDALSLEDLREAERNVRGGGGGGSGRGDGSRGGGGSGGAADTGGRTGAGREGAPSPRSGKSRRTKP